MNSNGMQLTRCKKCHKKCVTNTMGKHLRQSSKCLQAYVETSIPMQEDARPVLELNKDETEHYHALRKAECFKEISEWVYFRYMGGPMQDSLRNGVNRWVEFAIDHIGPVLHDIVNDPVKENLILNLISNRMDFFRGLETEAKIEAHGFQNYPVPRSMCNIVGTQPNDKCYHTMVDDWMVTMLRYNDSARAEIIAESELMKSGHYEQAPTVFSNFKHGSAFRGHPFAKKHVDQPGQPILVLITLMVGYDEMDPLNALGQQRGEKCLSGFYGACGNLKAKERFKHENMCLLSICEDPVLKRCDPIKVFSGADPVTGELLTDDDSSPGAQFRAGKGGLLRKVTHCTVPTPIV
jgi:hypothetical protein